MAIIVEMVDFEKNFDKFYEMVLKGAEVIITKHGKQTLKMLRIEQDGAEPRD